MAAATLEDSVGYAHDELSTEEIRADPFYSNTFVFERFLSVHGREVVTRRNVGNVFQCNDALSAAITILLILLPLTSSGIIGSHHTCDYCSQVINMVFLTIVSLCIDFSVSDSLLCVAVWC
jgi:hypothetical protein